MVFALAALWQDITRRILPSGLLDDARWLFPVLQLVFVALIFLVSWFILRSGLPDFLKAAFSIVPLATGLVTIGMMVPPIISIPIGAVICGTIIYILIHTKQHWLYAYAIALMSIILAAFTLIGGEI